VAINQLTTSNTFGQWLNTTITLIDTLNNFTDGGPANTFYVNTNLQIANNLTVGGNLTVSGNVTLDNIGFNDLTIAGNASINGTISGANTTVTNLVVSGNIARANITTSLAVGANATIYGNLTVGQNSTIPNLEVTNSVIFSQSGVVTFTSLDVTNNVTTSNLTVSQNSTLNNVTLTLGTFSSANITTFVGAANTDIYNYIEATANSTSAQLLAQDYIAIAVALG
jgi:cytoskeletal protein CcmA (bactofilin family)